MRIFAASLATETNTFAPLPTDRRAFEAALYCPPGTHPETPTLCSAPVVAARALRAQGHQVIEGTATWAEPAGMVGRAAYEGLRDEILGQLRAAMPVDIAVFGLHGCMVADGYDDCEGDLLARARAIAPDAVIGAELDLHAHLSPQMVAAADLIVAFKEFPHTDFLARAEDLLRLCVATAEGRIRPCPALYDLRLIGGYMTSREPGRSFTDHLLALEAAGDILSVSVIHGFQSADVHDVGTKILAYSDGSSAQAESLATRLAQEILSWTPDQATPHHKPEAAIRLAAGMPGQPIVLADRWDNPGGGVAGEQHRAAPRAAGPSRNPRRHRRHVGPGGGPALRRRRSGRQPAPALRRQGHTPERRTRGRPRDHPQRQRRLGNPVREQLGQPGRGRLHHHRPA